MAVKSGHLGVIRIGAVPDTIGEVRSWTMNIDPQLRQAGALGAATAKHSVGQNLITGQLVVAFDDDDTGQNSIVAGAIVALELYPAGNTSGESSFIGTAKIGTVAYAGGVDEDVLVTVDWAADTDFPEATVV